MRLFAVAVLAVLIAAPIASVQAAPATPTVSNMSVQEFLSYHSDLAKKLDKREYNRVSSRDRETIEKAQTEIRGLLSGKSKMDQLSDDERIKLFNAHERVIAAWEDAEDQRLICKRERKVGSNRLETVCTTVAEIRGATDEARRDRMRVRRCTGSEQCGGG